MWRGWVVLVAAGLLASPAVGKLKEKECEVCIKVLDKVTAASTSHHLSHHSSPTHFV
jgi:hypothetical protein